MSLKETQTQLYKIITAPVGVRKLLSKRRQKNLPLVGDTRLAAVDRLDIYANMYFFRIRDSLIEDFPAMYKILGATRFHNLITDYLVKFPPTHFSLRNAGENLPRFLKTHRERKTYKFLPDLALFEWNMISVFDASDVDLVTKADLLQIKPETWADLRLDFIPAIKLMNSDYPLTDLFSSFREKNKVAVKKSKSATLIWRKDFKVCHRSLDSLEENLLKVMLAGKSFSVACAKISKIKSSESDMQKIGACLLRWFDDKLVSRLHT